MNYIIGISIFVITLAYTIAVVAIDMKRKCALKHDSDKTEATCEGCLCNDEKCEYSKCDVKRLNCKQCYTSKIKTSIAFCPMRNKLNKSKTDVIVENILKESHQLRKDFGECD